MDSLTAAFYDVMYQYRIPFAPEGVAANLAAWHENKAPLVELLRRHPNWKEQELAVVFDFSESREIDHDSVDETKFEMMMLAHDAGLSGDDLSDFQTALNAATADYATIPDASRLETIRTHGRIKCAEGQKASRIINRLCCKFGLDQYQTERIQGEHGDNPTTVMVKPYNAIFARLADSLNPIRIPKTGILSVHPCDFLEMSSQKNSWQSCHRLNGGGYRAGCQSYMGDAVSMIFFTVDDDVKADFYHAPRLTRQIFAYKDGLLLQSRLYPNNDDETRKLYRGLVQNAIAQCLGVPNLWNVKSKPNESRPFLQTAEDSLHYPDYEYSYGLVSLLNGTPADRKLMIGSRSLCTCCGQLVQHICYTEDGTVMMSPEGIGGDDRAGVYMILRILQEAKCHVLFCEDEETGGQGARKFERSGIRPEVNYLVELDRRGGNDAVFYNCNNRDFIQYICGFGFMENQGSFSDISVVAPCLDVAAVNISAGYYNEHRQHEYVRLDQMEENIARVREIVLTNTERFAYRGYPSSRSFRNYGGEELTLWDMSLGSRKGPKALMELPDTACLVMGNHELGDARNHYIDIDGNVYLCLPDLSAAVLIAGASAYTDTGEPLTFSFRSAQSIRVMEFKEQPEYSEIELMIALPFAGHDNTWDDRSKLRMAFLIKHSAKTVTVGASGQPPAVNYRRRNEFLVNQADCLLAVYDNDRSIRSGTGMTVNLAKKKGIPVICIHPDTGIVSE